MAASAATGREDCLRLEALASIVIIRLVRQKNMEEDCILHSVFREVTDLGVTQTVVRLGILGSSHYRGTEVYFSSVDVRLSADVHYEKVTSMVSCLLAQLQMEPALVTFIRETFGPELQLLASPVDAPTAIYYSSTEADLRPLPSPSSTLNIQIIVPAYSHFYQQEIQLMEIYVKSRLGCEVIFEINGGRVELFPGSNARSLQLPTKEQLICTYEEAADFQDTLNVLLSISLNGLPIPTSDSLFDLISYRLFLHSASIFPRPITTTEKHFYTQLLQIPFIRVSVSQFHIHLSLIQIMGLNGVLDWAFQSVRGILLAEVIDNGEFQEYFTAVFAESAANLVAQICERGGRRELDILFPEPLSTEDLNKAIFEEAVSYSSH